VCVCVCVCEVDVETNGPIFTKLTMRVHGGMGPSIHKFPIPAALSRLRALGTDNSALNLLLTSGQTRSLYNPL
jgi:hypothetical protein